MTSQTTNPPSLIYRLASAACPRSERYWLAALLAESESVESGRARFVWLLGAWGVLGRANLRRAVSPLALALTLAAALVCTTPSLLGFEVLNTDDDLFAGIAAAFAAGFMALLILALLRERESSSAFPAGRL